MGVTTLVDNTLNLVDNLASLVDKIQGLVDIKNLVDKTPQFIGQN